MRLAPWYPQGTIISRGLHRDPLDNYRVFVGKVGSFEVRKDIMFQLVYLILYMEGNYSNGIGNDNKAESGL